MQIISTKKKQSNLIQMSLSLTIASSEDKDDLPVSLQRALQGSPLRSPEGGRRFVRWMLALLLITFLGQSAIFASMSSSAMEVFLGGLTLATISSIPTGPHLLSGSQGARIALAPVRKPDLGSRYRHRASCNAFGFGLIVLTEALGSMTNPASGHYKRDSVLLLFWFK
jgi:hypothetical protein